MNILKLLLISINIILLNMNDLKSIYEIDKIKNKILDRKVLKVINVQDKIINIITT